ncbi:AraC family transcriptional regulator InvF [Chromobacterium haemolyticum]|uniref:AraC family transcriptional regulator InvF n=1 Tax=Chromobacterium haemolyticum TaxID=394935 RepID=A0ABS3GIS5_9NEIS|nr:AraC family transcriptional regulator InvF [Chromobacterium haemolyticum]MBK0415619.1 AraC family transcriptional regulator InvF [Chromobacterium haemolyticum]MBO0414961.1 AraC family transcriptional regulator InvF [Chromobacterium haemolyticum]MBO0498222.1 AraC family transcriptional regulator InvF [Chromobacterium haemolyticum]
MTDNDVLLPLETLEAAAKRCAPAQDVWLLPPRREEARLELSWEEGVETLTLAADWQGLLLLDRVEVSVVAGALPFQPVRLEAFSKLLAFVDEAKADEARDADAPASEARCAQLPLVDLAAWQDRKRCEYWFLLQVLTPSPAFAALLALLRRSESYWLVRFLLAQSACGDKLQALGERYGVSYSHFRRLCRHALGNAAKTELRDWRMARSLLDVAEGRENLTQVALKHGYASSSHFSNEIKGLIGVSPRGLSNIIQLATK